MQAKSYYNHFRLNTPRKENFMGSVDKKQVISILEEIANLLELKGENAFKVRAFANAARILDGQPEDLASLAESGRLETLKGIGRGHIAGIVRELYEKGRSRDYEDLCEEFPDTLLQLFKIPGLGAKRIKQLYEKLDVKSVKQLEYVCWENKLANLEGFGAKSQDNILRAVEQFKKTRGHFLIDFAQAESRKVLDYLGRQSGVIQIEVAGSIRRSKELIKDIDILASAKNPEALHDALVKYPDVESVTAHGSTKSSVVLKSGMNCDLRTVSEKEFPYALYYFTGSKEHNVAVRTLAKKKNLKINEYGLFRGKRLVPCRDEEEIFKKVGLHYLAPEVRENTGEIEWVMRKPFPRLVEVRDIRGILHVHTTYSDGIASLKDMVLQAKKIGMGYIGIADHSQSAFYARGLKPADLVRQWKEIGKLEKECGIRIFRGVESDILPDGKLDYPDEVLARLDFVVASVHSRFNMDEKEMTARILRAMENKYCTMLGHPTGRLLLSREAYAVDMIQVIRAARKYGVILELNAHPQRLDLDWRMCQTAKKAGVKVSINPDAHSREGIGDYRYGVGIARKGWLEKSDILNTRTAAEAEKLLKQRRIS